MTSIQNSKERVDRLRDSDLRSYAQGSYRHVRKLKYKLTKANKQLAQQGLVLKQSRERRKKVLEEVKGLRKNLGEGQITLAVYQAQYLLGLLEAF